MNSGPRFDLVFMDVQMPNLDGIQSTKRIREMGFSAPIVALTAFAEESNIKDCYDCGMDFFLPKPIRRPELKKVLNKYCPTIHEEEGEHAALAVPKVHGTKSVTSTGSMSLRKVEAHELPSKPRTGKETISDSGRDGISPSS